MPFDMYGDVILTRDLTDCGLRTGDVGTVVERHTVPGVSDEGYSVEFFDMTGNTVAVVTLPASSAPADTSRSACRQGAKRVAYRNSQAHCRVCSQKTVWFQFAECP